MAEKQNLNGFGDPAVSKEQIESDPEYHIAWILSEHYNDSTPIGLCRYLGAARSILRKYAVAQKEAE